MTSSITIAVFFAAPTGVAPRTTKSRGPEQQPLEAHRRQISLVFRSAQEFHPHARAVLLTDETTFPSGLDGVETVRGPVDPEQLMMYRHVAQLNFVETLGDNELCLFLDADMLINRPLDALYRLGGDVLLTWRRKKSFVNGGFIGVRGARRYQAAAFLGRVLATVRDQFWHETGWGGVQAAFRTILADVIVRPEQTVLEAVDGCEVLFLPGGQWNWSLGSNRRSAILRPIRDPYVIHFKGWTKRLMEPYWQLHRETGTPGTRARVWAGVLAGAVADLTLPSSIKEWNRVSRKRPPPAERAP